MPQMVCILPEGAFIYQQSIDSQDSQEIQFQRFLCHVLVERLPQDGLEEAFVTLRDMYEFYATRSKVNALPSAPQKLPAKQGKSYERPSFHIEEE